MRIIQAFLTGRTMRVKVGHALSDPLPVPGGSPQGSLLANSLFCITAEGLNSDEPINDFEHNGHDTSLSSGNAFSASEGNDMPDTSSSSEDGNFNFFRAKRVEDFDTTVETSFRCGQETIDQVVGPLHGWRDEPATTRCYIDDYNIVEKVRSESSVSHITTKTTIRHTHAPKTEKKVRDVRQKASDLLMRVNEKKTQILCISTNHDDNRAYIETASGRLESKDSLKILGFTFGSDPSPKEHIATVKKKVRSRLWGLENLRTSGMGQDDLLFVYKTSVRPIADFASPVYHPMLTGKLSGELERLQRRAVKTIFGHEKHYRDALQEGLIESLQDRRQTLTENFARKAARNERFMERWFPVRRNENYELRNPEKYHIPKTRTDRMKTSPIYNMRRILNG